MLYVVATPIGNLDDITFRALEILKTVDTVICEDTRRTKQLLQHFDISKPLVSFHGYSSSAKVDEFIKRMKEGETYALVSDSGTPTISDPGYEVISKTVEEGIQVVPIPGAAAFLTALVASGLPVNRFWYYGFLPAKKGRETLFKKFSEMDETIVCYESPHKVMKTLEKWKEIMPDRRIVLARELTKMYEEFVRGTVSEVTEEMGARDSIKGEIVLILAPLS